LERAAGIDKPQLFSPPSPRLPFSCHGSGALASTPPDFELPGGETQYRAALGLESPTPLFLNPLPFRFRPLSIQGLRHAKCRPLRGGEIRSLMQTPGQTTRKGVKKKMKVILFLQALTLLVLAVRLLLG
jgi:hypothetical protein